MEKRRNFLINKRFQFSFLLPFVILLIVESAMIFMLFCYLSQDTVTTCYSNAILRVENTQNFFFIPLLLVTLIIVLGVALTGMIIFIVLSHRLAGPCYRFEQVLKQVEGGNLETRVNLRKNDQFDNLQKALNSFIASLSLRMGSIKKELEEVKAILAKSDDPAVISKEIDKVNALAEEIK